MTLDEAISLAKDKLPSYRASMVKVKSTAALYKATLGPYFPSVDVSSYQKKLYTTIGEFGAGGYELTLSYTLYDGGKRRANRNIAWLTLDTDKQELRKSLIELEYSVKVAYYTAIAKLGILDQREKQLQYAEKDHSIAQGRHKYGIARLSDVLQASVRLEQARINVIEAKGDFKKAFSEFNSLVGRPLNVQYDITGLLDTKGDLPDVGRLVEAALKRPEIKQAENSFKIAENNKSIALSAFYPVLSLSSTYTKTTGGGQVIFSPEEKTAGVIATWNLFELGKFFRQSSAGFEKVVSREKLDDVKRKVVLDTNKAYEDFITAYGKLDLAGQQLRYAEHNYSQAFKEYKAGKSDMLSLVQAEGLLADAEEQLINAKLNLVTGRAMLERVAAVETLELLRPGTTTAALKGL